MAFTLNDTYDLRICRDSSKDHSKLSDVRNILFESACMPTFVRNDSSTFGEDNSLPSTERRSSKVPKLEEISEENFEEEVDSELNTEETDSDENEVENETPILLEEPTERIQVFLRIRPETKAENYEIDNDKNILWVKNPTKANKLTQLNYFKFNKIFDESTEQWPVVETCAIPLLRDLILGDNSLLFTYGITSSGKSFTMRGNRQQPGIVPTILAFLFKTLENNLRPNQQPAYKPSKFNSLIVLSKADQFKENRAKQKLLNYIKDVYEINREIDDFQKFSSILLENEQRNESYVSLLRNEIDESSITGLWVSYWEVYNDKVYDLLKPGNLNRRQSTVTLQSVNSANNEKLFIPTGLTEVYVNSAEEALQIYLYGQENLKKHISSTALNSASSRSHSSFNISLIKTFGENNQNALVSNLSFCDLAGRERTKKSQVERAHLKEANFINKSLLLLGQCIRSLRSKKPQNVNYRNSELTKIFQPYLNGTSGRMYIIYNLNPVAELFNDSYYSLDFCNSARDVIVNTVRNKAIVEINRKLDDSRDEQLEASFMEDEEHFHSLRREVQNLSMHIADKAAQNMSENCSCNHEELLLRINQLQDFIEEIQRQKQVQEMTLKREMYKQTKETQDLYQEIVQKKEEDIISIRRILEERLDFNEKLYRRNFEQMKSAQEKMKLEMFEKEEEVIKANSKIESMSVQLESADIHIAELTRELSEQSKLHSQIESMSVQLESADIKIAELTGTLHELTNLQFNKDSTIADLKNSLVEKDKVVKKKEKAISNLRNELSSVTLEINEKHRLEEDLKEKDKEIVSLKNCLDGISAEKQRLEKELQAIKEETFKLKEKAEEEFKFLKEASFESAASSQENVKPKATRKKATKKAKATKQKIDDDEIELIMTVTKKNSSNDVQHMNGEMCLGLSATKNFQNYSVKKKLHMSAAKRLDTSPILSPMDAKKNIEAGKTNKPYNTRQGRNCKRLF